MKNKIAPSGTFIWVDVRDVALAHVRAIEVPEAGGKRFFVVAGYFSNKDIIDIVRDSNPELESKLPPKDFESDLPKNIYEIDNRRSKDVLGLKYKPLRETVEDTVSSLQAVGA